jgi:hypothetical protein
MSHIKKQGELASRRQPTVENETDKGQLSSLSSLFTSKDIGAAMVNPCIFFSNTTCAHRCLFPDETKTVCPHGGPRLVRRERPPTGTTNAYLSIAPAEREDAFLKGRSQS